MPRGNRLLDPGSGNPLVDQMGGGVTWADAAQQRWQQYQQWVAQQRAEGIARGEIDPATGWPTQAGLVDAARQYGNALLGSTTAPGIRAFHGSPHSFDRFDLSKIGTGEGAQAFGHGLYFAEHEPTAQGYRDALANRELWVGGKKVGEIGDIGTDPMAHAALNLHMDHGNAEAAKARVNQAVERRAIGGFGYGRDEGARIIAAIDDVAAKGYEVKPGGKMYEVAIKADPATMLHWDKPLSEQSPAVHQALADAGLYRDQGATAKDIAQLGITGQDAYKQLLLERGGPMYPGRNAVDASAAASAALREAGIPGIRYLDQGSRDTGEGTHNHVVFDDKLIDIMRKYGIAGLTAAGIANPFGGQPAADSPPPAQQ